MSEWKKFGGDSDDKSTLDGLITRNLLEIRNTRVNRIGSYAFQSCSNLMTANFPSVASIGNSAFQQCGRLTTADFPLLGRIGATAFFSCGMLTTLVLRRNTVATLEHTNAFTNTPIASGTGYIYVPDDQVDNYKITTNWVTYANQIKGISELEEAE